jgi:hypothetical protein
MASRNCQVRTELPWPPQAAHFAHLWAYASRGFSRSGGAPPACGRIELAIRRTASTIGKASTWTPSTASDRVHPPVRDGADDQIPGDHRGTP